MCQEHNLLPHCSSGELAQYASCFCRMPSSLNTIRHSQYLMRSPFCLLRFLPLSSCGIMRRTWGMGSERQGWALALTGGVTLRKLFKGSLSFHLLSGHKDSYLMGICRRSKWQCMYMSQPLQSGCLVSFVSFPTSLLPSWANPLELTPPYPGPAFPATPVLSSLHVQILPGFQEVPLQTFSSSDMSWSVWSYSVMCFFFYHSIIISLFSVPY